MTDQSNPPNDLMTDTQVTQADREAAADMWEHHAGKRTDFARRVAIGNGAMAEPALVAVAA